MITTVIGRGIASKTIGFAIAHRFNTVRSVQVVPTTGTAMVDLITDQA